MNDYIFEENGKMYICKSASYISGGFRSAEVWKERKSIPDKLKNTIPRGSGIIIEDKGIKYMLYNTSGKACGKWFTYLCPGIKFEQPPKIPEGVRNGYDFITKNFHNGFMEIKKTKRKNESFVRINAIYSPLTADDYTAKPNEILEKMEHYHKMKEYFSFDLYEGICFGEWIYDTDVLYEKYLNEDITIDDILNDLEGNWKYMSGSGEIVFFNE